MKKLNKISLALMVSIIAFSNAAIAQITGTTPVAFGATYTYTYNDGGTVNNITWSTTRGQVVGQGGSSVSYTVDITWTSSGTTSLIAYENGVQIASKAITVNSCTIGNPTVTSSTSRCGSGTLTLTATTGSGGSGVRWYQNSTGGSPLSSSTSYTTGNISGNTTLYVVSTASGGCESYPRTSVPITINSLPSPPATVTGATRCGTGSVTLSGTVLHSPAEFLVWYSAPTGGSYAGGGYLTTGSSYTTPSLSSTTNYYVSTATANGCESSEARSTVTATINPNPSLYTVGGGGSYCTGGSGVTVTLSGSQTGINYQLKIDGSSSGSPVAGTGSSLSWNNQTTASSNYTVVATHATGGCVKTMTGSATISVNSLPTSFNLSGGSSFCPGGSGVSVGLTGSESGVNYQLIVNGSNWGSAVAGTGGALNWSGVTATGSCSVQATNASSGCSRTMGGSATVSTYSLPTQYTVGGAGTICSGQTTSVTLSSSQNGVNYQLKLNGSNTGSPVAGQSGFGQTWTGLGSAGTYTIVATDATTGCVQTMTGSATITVNSLPTQFNVGGGGSYCSGGSGVSVTLSNSVTGTNYQLKINGTNSGSPMSGTGGGLTWTAQTTAGTYTVQATIVSTGCTQTMSGSATVTVNPLPAQYTLSGGGGICPGATTSVTLSSSQAGVNYQMKLNGTNSGSAVSGTGSSLVFGSLSSAGTYTVVATNATTSCTQTMTGSPTISINSVPSAPAVSGNARFGTGTLTLSATGGSGGDVYKWYNPSGVLQQTGSGFTTSSFSTTTSNAYYVTITNSSGCVSSVTWVSISIYISPLVSSTTPYLYMGNSATLSPGSTYDTYSWTNKVGAVVATTQNYTTSTPDTYKVTVTKNGLSGASPNYILGTELSGQKINYISNYSVLVDGITDTTHLEQQPVGNVSQTVEYFDGLGRSLQKVIPQGSPAKKDIVSPVVYDPLGRQPKEYLPYVDATDNGRYKTSSLVSSGVYTNSPHYNFYHGSSDNVSDDDNPYSVTIFEASPLNRPLQNMGAGQAWQVSGSEKAVVHGYLLNKHGTSAGQEKIIIWKISGGLPIRLTALNSGYYPTGSLTIKSTKDEMGNEIRDYIDKEGHTILRKAYVTGTTTDFITSGNWAETYYIYNDIGKVAFVLQPELSKTLAASSTLNPSATDLANFAFQYKYDSRQRMVVKWVPGATDSIIMIYDKRDRLVLTQDGNRRTTNYWVFTKYDLLNRPILTGIKDTTVALTRLQMQSVVDNYYKKASSRWGESPGGTVHGYTTRSYPALTDPNKYLTVTYYDNYTWKNTLYDSARLSFKYDDLPSEQVTSYSRNLRGQVTGGKTKVLDGGPWGGVTWLASSTYYDEHHRVVQTVSDNYKGEIDRVTSVLDFAGRIIKTKTIHTESDIHWSGLAGINLVGNKVLSASTGGWDISGGGSVEVLAAGTDGWVEATVIDISSNDQWIIGLSSSNPDNTRSTINYGIGLASTGVLKTYENSSTGTSRGSVVVGDVLRVWRQGTAVKFYKNGTLLATAAAASSSSLVVDAALYLSPTGLSNVRTSFSKTTQSVVRRFQYDHASRVVKAWHTINSGAEVLLVSNAYNELGQLADKKLHSADNGTTGKQSVDYRYNIRGWLTSINGAELTDPVKNDDAGSQAKDLFGMDLSYNTVESGLNNNALFNGNISAMRWSNNLGVGTMKINAYKYSYDALNRITTAGFVQRDSLAWVTNTSQAFNESGYSYDLNGNILGLTRKGKTGSNMDALTYDYGSGSAKSNKLLKVTDSGDDANGFKEINTSQNDYVYDANGNMIWDANNGGKNVVTNSSFIGGSSGWTVSDPASRLQFASDDISIPGTGTNAVLTQTNVISPGKTYAVVVDMVRNSSAGDLFFEVGGAGFVLFTTGVNVYYVTAGSGRDLVVTVTSQYYGVIRSIEVYGVTVVGYNVLNLPERVFRGSDGEIRYIYDAQGRKLAQEVYNGTGLRTKKSDYDGEIFYENDTLKFINHEEGRAVMTAASPEYQYHLKDHLGNVRLTFTTVNQIDTSLATLETANVSAEHNNFLYYDEAVKINSTLFDHTNTGTTYYSTRLNGSANERTGLAKSISVMPGDTVKLEVYAKYLDPNSSNWTTALNNLITSIANGTAPAGTFVDGGATGSTGGITPPFGTILNKGSETGTAPKAYLNYLVFDRDYNFKYGDFIRVSTAAREYGQDGAHEKLSKKLLMKEAGYVYVYLSNDNYALGGSQIEVYFDDFKVTQTKSPVVQSQDYYAFGLAFNNYSRENSMINQYKYNGKELQDELSVGWLDYGARMYMPEIGRWGTVDPVAQVAMEWTPYRYGYDNPVRFWDLGGYLEMDPATIKAYQTLANYLINGIQGVLGQAGVIRAIMKYGQFSEQQIKQDLQWGSGPKVVVSSGHFTNDPDAVGMYFESAGENILYINAKYVKALEKMPPGKERDALLFRISAAILHEYVHYGDDQDGIDYNGEVGEGEEGNAFEIEAYGMNINNVKDAKQLLDKWLKKGADSEEQQKQNDENQKKRDNLSSLINNFSSLEEGTYTWNGSEWKKQDK